MEIEKDRLLFDESGGGVTFSGGEPLSQDKFLKAMLIGCKERRLNSAVDTSGTGSLSSIDTLLLADLILFDIKGLNHHRSTKETGIDVGEIEAVLESLAKNQKRIWLRMPYIPGYGLANESIESIMEWLEVRKEWFERINILPFHRTASRKYELLGWDDAMKGQPDMSEKRVTIFAEQLRTVHKDIRIGG